jgi:2-keto-4-pentenoate hydratase
MLEHSNTSDTQDTVTVMSSRTSHEKKSSESVDSLCQITKTIHSFVELVDLMPQNDARTSLLRIISDHLEGDLLQLRRELS